MIPGSSRPSGRSSASWSATGLCRATPSRRPPLRGAVPTARAPARGRERDGLGLRYTQPQAPEGAAGTDVDGLPGAEGAFLACSFWLVNALHMIGEYDEATALFEHLLALRTDLGLLSEEYDPRYGRLVGNFPQAFSHMPLIQSALNLDDHAGHHCRRDRRQRRKIGRASCRERV